MSAAALLLVTGLAVQSSQPPMKVGLAAYLQMAYAGLKADLTSAAEAMPEADYGSKPTSMAEVRTFGQTIAHVAAGHFGICAALRGVPNPYGTTKLEERASAKAEVVKWLAQSFAFCDPLIASLTDDNANELVKQARAEMPRSAAVIGLIAHDAEMYGITTVYLRAKNIVPPSTARERRSR